MSHTSPSLDKDLFDSYGKAYSLKRICEDKDKDEDPPAGPDQRLTKKKTSKDVEPLRGSKSKESKSSSSKGSKKTKIDFRDLLRLGISQMAKEDSLLTLLTSDELSGRSFLHLGHAYEVEITYHMELEYHFEECYKVVTDRLDWTNLEGHQYPFDLSKPLPLIEVQGRQVVPTDYFINNDLEYLKGGSLSKKYITQEKTEKA
ncbi:hypothetical protein Tco_0425540 [Tanacetum coccineum]